MAYIKYSDIVRDTRGLALPNYRVKVLTSAGAEVNIYADSSGTRFTDGAGGTVNYCVANDKGKAEFYWTPATGQVLQVLDTAGEQVDIDADFADKFVIANLPGEVPQSSVTDLETDLTAINSEVATKAATADLAADTGAAAIGFKQTGTGASSRTAQAKFQETVSVKDFGAVGNGVADDTAAIQAAIDSNPGSLIFPAGTYRVSCGSGDSQCLLLDNNTNLIGPSGQQRTRIVGYMPGNTTGAVLRVEVAGSGDIRNWTMRGLGMYPDPSTGGKDGLYISSSGLPMLTCEITDCFFGRNPSNAGRAAFLGYVWAHSLVRGNTFSGGVRAECGDANLFLKNLSFGSAAEFAYIFNLVDGVRNNTIRDCTIVNQGGSMHVIDGQEIRFVNNQCEQAGGVNANPVESMIWLQGSTRKVENTVISENNFGGGTNYKRSIYVDNARGTKITNGNRFIAPGQDSVGGNADVFITSNARDTLIGDNFVKASAFSTRLDRVTPVKTNDSGVNTINSRRTPTTSNGWSGGDFYKDRAGIVRFRSLLDGGTTTAGTIMATMPQGYWPAQKVDVVRRNLLNTTNDLSTSSWTRSAITVTAEQGTAPNGRNEYQLIAAQATTATHQIRDNGTNLTTTDPLKVSFYVQRTSGTTESTIRGLLDGPTGNATFTVNLSTGAVVITPAGGAAASATSTASGSGWRVVITYTPAATGLHYLRFTPKNESSVYNSYAGDPAVHNFLLWGPQLEVTGTTTAYQAVYSASNFSTQMFDDTLNVTTSGGTETVTISQSGVIKAATLTASDVTMPSYQSDAEA